jgi:NAD-dependent deacetylase
VLDFYNDTRRSFRAAHIEPNAAHRRWPAGAEVRGRGHVVTQNIDPLHEMAGSKRVLHMHGRDGEIRCMNCGTVLESDADLTPQSVCPNCKAVGELRPNIVWFGEMPHAHGRDLRGARPLRPVPVDRHLGRGLSRGGLRAAVRRAAPRAHTVELNLEPSGNQPLFQRAHLRPRHRIVPPMSSACWRRLANRRKTACPTCRTPTGRTAPTHRARLHGQNF